MDKEKIKQLRDTLEQLKRLKENKGVIAILTSDNESIAIDTETMSAMLAAAIISTEHRLDIAKFGAPSDNLQESREYKAAMALENAVNSFSFNPERFAEAIPYMHRTLQQNIFRLIRCCVCAMADAEDWRIDDRNRASHEMCKALADIIKEYPLPYI